MQISGRETNTKQHLFWIKYFADYKRFTIFEKDYQHFKLHNYEKILFLPNYYCYCMLCYLPIELRMRPIAN